MCIIDATSCCYLGVQVQRRLYQRRYCRIVRPFMGLRKFRYGHRAKGLKFSEEPTTPNLKTTFEKNDQKSRWSWGNVQRLVAAATVVGCNRGPVGDLLQFSETSSAIVLRMAAALLIAEVLSSGRCKESYSNECQCLVIAVDCEELRTNMLSVLHRALHLGLVVRAREWLLLTDELGFVAVDSVEQLYLLV